MSVILKLKGVNFNNSSLPSLPKIYRDGLLGAWRPSTNLSSMIDLSGNGATLTQVGEVDFNSFGVKVTPLTGFTTSITETPTFSIVVAYRYEVEIGSVSGTMQVVGSRNNIPDPDQGASIMVGLFTDDDSTGSRIQHSLSMGTAGAVANYRGTKITQPTPSSPYLSPWQYVIATYESVSRTYHIYEPAKSSDITGTGGASIFRTENTWNMGVVDGAVDNGGTATIAEVLFYNKALSPSEVEEIYGYSVDYLSTKGITLSDSTG